MPVAELFLLSYFYRIFGLTLATDLECPELISIDATEAVDIRIALGHVPETIENPIHSTTWVQVGKGVFQFLIKGVARYRVENGSSILVDVASGAAEGDVRLYLLGMAFGALLHQRRLLPLHVCAVELHGGVYAFCGESGAGKSTLAAAFHRQGMNLLCDDLGVVVPSQQGEVLFYPGFPRIKLWRDALDHFDIDSGSLIRDQSRVDKFHLSLHQSFQLKPLPLLRLYDLQRGDTLSHTHIGALTRDEGLALLIGNTYRFELVRWTGSVQDHLLQCAKVSNAISAFRFTRVWDFMQINRSVGEILAHMHDEQNGDIT